MACASVNVSIYDNNTNTISKLSGVCYNEFDYIKKQLESLNIQEVLDTKSIETAKQLLIDVDIWGSKDTEFVLNNLETKNLKDIFTIYGNSDDANFSFLWFHGEWHCFFYGDYQEKRNFITCAIYLEKSFNLEDGEYLNVFEKHGFFTYHFYLKNGKKMVVSTNDKNKKVPTKYQNIINVIEQIKD